MPMGNFRMPEGFNDGNYPYMQVPPPSHPMVPPPPHLAPTASGFVGYNPHINRPIHQVYPNRYYQNDSRFMPPYFNFNNFNPYRSEEMPTFPNRLENTQPMWLHQPQQQHQQQQPQATTSNYQAYPPQASMYPQNMPVNPQKASTYFAPPPRDSGTRPGQNTTRSSFDSSKP